MFHSDIVNSGIHITKDEILEIATQEEIFELGLGFYPEEERNYTSPFRKDKNPGCFFEYYEGTLRFKDFADSRRINGVTVNNCTCFDSIIIKKGYTFGETLRYIHYHFKDRVPDKKRKYLIENKYSKPRTNIIVPYSRPFNTYDKDFWSDYYITKDNLIEDSVFAVKNLYIKTSSKSFTLSFSGLNVSYCYPDFEENRKKIYMPRREKKKRFITDCKDEDIGGWFDLPVLGNLLVITKSYKDYRVLKNTGLTVIWLQSENILPKEKLEQLVKRFDKIVVFYDNDRAGYVGSENIVDFLNSCMEDIASRLFVPKVKNVTDPSDFIKYNIIDFKKLIKMYFKDEAYKIN